jgi:hypothetical protein
MFPAASLVRRWRGDDGAPSRAARAARAARWLAAATGTLNLALATWFVVSLLGFAETYVWPAGTVSAITRLWLLSVPLTLGITVLAVVAWRNRYWDIAGRVHYSLVALAAVVFVLFLGNWNLIAF